MPRAISRYLISEPIGGFINFSRLATHSTLKSEIALKEVVRLRKTTGLTEMMNLQLAIRSGYAMRLRQLTKVVTPRLFWC
jgi:hypothetical protein